MRMAIRIILVLCGSALVVLSLLLIRNWLIEHYVHAWKEGKDTSAVRWIAPLAYLGDPEAQCHLAWAYAIGTVDIQDDEKAIYWFRRCGPPIGMTRNEKVDAVALNAVWVAKEYASRHDVNACMRWLKRAIDGGVPEALNESCRQP